MKKLTAGIFATILGLTAIDAYAALPAGVSKVATTNYVDGAMGAAVTSAVTTAKSYTDTEIKKIEIPTLEGYATTGDVATAKSEAISTAAADATTKAGQALTDANAYTDTKVGNLGTSTDVVSYIGAQGYATEGYADAEAAGALTDAKAYTDEKVGALPQGTADVVTYVDAKTSGIASDTELQALKTTVSGHTTSITNLTNDKLDKSTYNTDKATFETIDGAAGKYEPILDEAARAAITSGIDATKVGQIQTAITNSTSALSQAETAATNALEAKNTATTANATAGEAKTAAQNAQTTADGAVATANAADTTAKAAQKDAEDAAAEAQAATSAVATLTTTVDGHTTSINTLTDNKLDKSVYNTDKPTFALKTEVQAVDAKLANYVTWDDVDNSYGD